MSQHILLGETNKFEYHWYDSRDRSLGCLFGCRSLCSTTWQRKQVDEK